MKKALTVFLMLALVGSVFAAEPVADVADVNIAEFSGNASVQWGVDLDAGKTGFKNAYQVDLKLNLLNSGSKSTTGDGVWGELVIKTDEDSFIGWRNGDDKPMVGDAVFPANTGMTSNLNLDAYVDVAKIHFGSAYIGIKRGDTQTGELKMDAAIRSSDDDQAKWLTDVGPDKFSQGIVAGYANDMFNVAVDLRSYGVDQFNIWTIVVKKTGTDVKFEEKYASKEAAEQAIIRWNATTDYTAEFKEGSADAASSSSVHNINNQYTNAYAFAAEAEFTGVENLSVKAGVSYNFSDKYYADAKEDKSSNLNNVLGYSASAGYKLALNDTYYIRPQIGFTGSTEFLDGSINIGSATIAEASGSKTSMAMAAGLLFGWGDIGVDANAGVPFLDDDMAKKVSPGVGVVAYIPLPTITSGSGKMGGIDGEGSVTEGSYYAARIMPSFFSGEIVPNLTAAAYADIGIMQKKVTSYGKDLADWSDTKVDPANKDMAFAVAMGAKYAIPVGEMTVTPNLGIRFANASYMDNIKQEEGLPTELPAEKDDAVFGGMGDQEKDGTLYDGNFMNLKAGVDVTGLIDNTTLSVIYESRNLLNGKEATEGSKDNIQKLGTLNFKVKIAL